MEKYDEDVCEEVAREKREYSRNYYAKNKNRIKERRLAREAKKAGSIPAYEHGKTRVMGEGPTIDSDQNSPKTVNMQDLVNGATFRYPKGKEDYQIAVHWVRAYGGKKPEFFFKQISNGVLRKLKSAPVVQTQIRYTVKDKD